MTSRFPVTQSEHSLSWYAELRLGFAESRADPPLLTERGDFIMLGRGKARCRMG
jgi:hypothetical protein